MSVNGAWYWDGSTWRRTVESPWSAPPRHPARRRNAGIVAAVLAAPLVFLLTLVALGRALAATARIVVGVFAVGAVVALMIFAIAALLHT